MYRITQAFPIINTINDKGIHNIYRSVINKIYSVIPKTLFKSHIYDFKDNSKNIFAYKDGSLVNMAEASRLPYPTFRIEFNSQGANIQDTQINSTVAPMQMYPIAEGINSEMRGYTPVYADKYGIQIFASEIFSRATFNLTLAVQTLDDRNNLSRLLDSNLKQHYGYEMNNIIAQYLLPNEAIIFLRDALYYKEMNELRSKQAKLSKEAVLDLATQIDNDFKHHITAYGKDIITSVQISPNVKSDDINLAYSRNTTVYFKLNNKFNISDGERRGELYDRYELSTDGYIEFYQPITFIINTPSIIKGQWIKNHTFEHRIPNDKGYLEGKAYPSIYVETRDLTKYKVFKEKWENQVFEDQEFLCNNGSDMYPILEKLIKTSAKIEESGVVAYQIYEVQKKWENQEELLYFLAHLKIQIPNPATFIDKVLIVLPKLTEEEFKDIFKIYIWKGNYELPNDKYSLKKDLSLYLYETNDQDVYSFKLLADRRKIAIKYRLITEFNE